MISIYSTVSGVGGEGWVALNGLMVRVRMWWTWRTSAIKQVWPHDDSQVVVNFFQDNFSLGSQLYQHLTEVSLPWRICSGLLAGSTAALAANPADVVLIRMQADSGWPTACLGHPPWSWHMAHGVGENTKLWVACWWTFGGKFSLALVIPPPRSLQNWLCTDTPSPLGNPSPDESLKRH